ncbi:MAG: ComEC/Rec2 family competence protein [Chlorobiaceae bacterium]
MKNIKALRDSVQFSLEPYPALRLLFTIIAGILIGVNLFLPLEVWLLLCILSLLALLSGVVYEQVRQTGQFPLPFSTISYTLFVLFCFAAYSDYQMHYAPKNGLIRFSGKTVLLYGRVDGQPHCSEKGVSWIMDVEEIFDNGRIIRLRDRAKVFMHSGNDSVTAIHYGDMVRVKGQLTIIPEAANKGEFDPRKNSRMKQVLVQFYCAGPWNVQHEGAPRLDSFERFIVLPVYEYMMKSLEQLIPGGEERQLAAGVLIGEKASLPDELFEAFKITGTAHILAVSGLNVGLLAFSIHICLQRLKVTMTGRWISFLLVAFILVVYTYVTGNSSSVKRAAIMSAVLIGGETLGRKIYPLNSLALSDVLILLFDPLDLFNPGFLMTNSAVAAILLIYHPFHSLLQKKEGFLQAAARFFLSSFIITVASIIGVSPVIGYYFGTFSLIGLFANFPVVLFSTLLMYALVPMLLLNLVSSYAASFFAASATFFAELTLRSALFFSRVPVGSITLKPDLPEVFLYYIVLGAALCFFYQKAWGKVAVSILFGINIIFWYSFFFHPQPDPPDLLTVNLGRNLAALFSSGSETVLIDAGQESRNYTRISRQLDEYGLSAPEAVVQFYSPDSVIAKVPTRRHMLQSDTLLSLPSVLIARPEQKVLKLWSRKYSMLMVSGTSRLKEKELYKADIVLLWVFRFAEKQQQQLNSWLNYARPKRCIIIPAPFLSHAHSVALHHYATGRTGLEIRSKSRQVVIQ